VTCHELRIKNPDDVGQFCAFEAFKAVPPGKS
jgi:hypothetical protein